MARDRDRERLVARAQLREPFRAGVLVGLGMQAAALEAAAKLVEVLAGETFAGVRLGVALAPGGAERVREVSERVPADPEGQLGGLGRTLGTGGKGVPGRAAGR